jgi:hypothetical protein
MNKLKIRNFNVLKTVRAVTFTALCSTHYAAAAEKPSSLEPPLNATTAAASAAEEAPASSNFTAQVMGHNAAASPDAALVVATSTIEYTCGHNAARRIIRVFENTATGFACEVTYEKDTGTQTLWTAQYDQDFCAQKAAAFSAKQVGWGWVCIDGNGEAVSAMLAKPTVEALAIDTPEKDIPATETKPSATAAQAEIDTTQERFEIESFNTEPSANE